MMITTIMTMISSMGMDMSNTMRIHGDDHRRQRLRHTQGRA